MSEVKQRCCVKVGEWLRYTCSKTGKVERDGKWYCGTHDPIAVKARDDKRMTAWKAKWDAETAANEATAAKRKETQRRADCFDELVEALSHTAAVCAGEISSKNGLINALEKARSALKKAQGEV